MPKLENKGFTALELVVSVAIIMVVSAGALISFINSRNLRDLATSGQNILSLLRQAQARSLAGENNSPWGVHFDQTQAVLYQGPVYAGSATTETHRLPARIEIININLAGGGGEVLFKKLDGTTDQSGTIEVRVQESASQTLPITINPSGKVFETKTAPAPSGTRIIDARHRAFSLGWSIKNSITLTLTFSDPPNPNTVLNLTMLPPPPRTTFDWSGTLTVGGQNQILRLHANSLTDTDTILQVDR